MAEPVLVERTVAAFAPLSGDAIALAMAGEPTRERHDGAVAAIPAFACLEANGYSQPPLIQF